MALSSGHPTAQRLRAVVLGDFGISMVGRADLGSRKARHLLQLLTLARGRPITVDRLIEELWGDAAPARPTDQVAVLVSRLRRVLGRERLLHGPGGYRFVVDQLDLDEAIAGVARSADLLAGGSVEHAYSCAIMAAAELARGVLPEQFDAPWLEPDRDLARRQLARSRCVAATAALGLGRLADVADLGARALTDDPYDEEMLRLVMTADVRSGRVASALALYASVRRRMIDELGAGPSPETEALHTAILIESATRDAEAVGAADRGADPSAAIGAIGAGRAERTPVEAEPMVGRREQLARLVAAVGARRSARPAARPAVVELRAEAGMGKTTVLAALAAALSARGTTVLAGACDDNDRSLPLQVVLSALRDHLALLDPVRAADVIGTQRDLLGAFLGRDAEVAVDVLSGGALGTTVLFAGIHAVLERLAPVVVLIDDAHLAGPATLDWIRYVASQPGDLAVVAARRPGEGAAIPAVAELVELPPFDLDDVIAVVGADRAPELLERSAGNPLFLGQLAGAGDGELPDSVRDAVSARCDRMGPSTSRALRTAAVIGPLVEVDLLAEVLGAPTDEILATLESGAAQRLLDETDAGFTFHHDLVRDALAAAVGPARVALIHRETARALSTRPASDPLDVARHARLGGDSATAAGALDRAAARAAERFDHDVADRLLGEALILEDTADRRIARSRVRTNAGRFGAALDDVAVASAVRLDAAALEVGGWASYYDRDFDRARRYADDGLRLADERSTRASCLVLAGRVRHADGDLLGAEPLLERAEELAEGVDRAAATAWLGVLRSHQGRYAEALDLLRTITLPGAAADRTSVVLHALMFSGHALASAGRPVEALAVLEEFGREIDRRGATRFAGRAENFRAWVLRGVGELDRADELNHRALGATGRPSNETVMAAHLDLAEGWLIRGDVDRARREVGLAADADEGDLVFGWRQRMKARLHLARLDLVAGDPCAALGGAEQLLAESGRLAVPRYEVPARLLVAAATHALGEPVDLNAVERDLDRLDAVAGLESWQLTADLASGFDKDAWRRRAVDGATSLAGRAGPHRPALTRLMERVITDRP